MLENDLVLFSLRQCFPTQKQRHRPFPGNKMSNWKGTNESELVKYQNESKLVKYQ